MLLSSIHFVFFLVTTWLIESFSYSFSISRAKKGDMQSIAFLIATEKYQIQWSPPSSLHNSENLRLVQIEQDRLLENLVNAETTPRYLCAFRADSISDDNDNNNGKSDDVIGYFDIDSSEECMKINGNPTPYISDFVVSSLWRRQGIGSCMLECADQICVNEWGVDRVHLWVDTCNTAAVRLYCKNGYVPIFGYTLPSSPNDGEWGPLTKIEFPEDEVNSEGNPICSGHKNWAYNSSFLSSFRRVLARKIIL